MDGRGDLTRPLVAICAVGFALGYARIYFGLDFGDDSFAVGVPYAFTRGARPFVDELLVQQTGSLELTPLVWLYAAVVGSADGIVLFVRHLYIGLVLLAGWATYIGLRDVVGRKRALITALAATVILPTAKPIVNYKTLGTFLLTVALFAGVSGRRAASGLALAAAVFAYPPLFVPALVFAALLLRDSRSPRGRIAFLTAGTVGALAALVVLLAFGPGNVESSVRYTRDAGATGGIDKLGQVASGAVTGIRDVVDAVPHITAFPFTSYFVTYTALAGALLFRSGRLEPPARRLLVLVWTPSLVAGLATAYSSTNAFLDATIGLIPAFLVTIALARSVWVPAAAVVLLLVFQWGFVYRDKPVGDLSCRVQSGPYRGIFTTPERCAFVRQLEADLKRHRSGRRSVLFYPGFPAGALLSDLRPVGPATWMDPIGSHPGLDRSVYTSHLAKPENRPDLVFEMRSVPGGSFADVGGEAPDVRALLERLRYREVAARERYRVLVAPGPRP